MALEFVWTGTSDNMGGGGGRHRRLSSAQLDFVARHECEHSSTANWDWSLPPRLPDVSFTTEDTVMRWLTAHLTKTVTLGMTRDGRGRWERRAAGQKRQRFGLQQRTAVASRVVMFFKSISVNLGFITNKIEVTVETQTKNVLVCFFGLCRLWIKFLGHCVVLEKET